jgi:SAM-dependent methyltransferase
MLSRVFRSVSARARRKRARVFRSLIQVTERTTILDVGSEKGHAIHQVLSGTPAQPANVYIADISADAVKEGQRLYQFNPVVLGEDGSLPFPDGHFDVVYCSSVIEHVTCPKDLVWEIHASSEFRAHAVSAQRRFAAEIRRVGRSYFVQTPYRHFPVESHSWLPFLNWLPRPVVIRILRLSNRYWIKQTKPDFYLLDRQEFGKLFPDADIYVERLLGIPKSLIAVKKNNQSFRYP